MLKYTIITDGAYSSKRNQGGLAFIILDESGNEVGRFSKGFKNTTNNRMELLSVIFGLEAIITPSEITVISDSQWVIGCASKGWKRKKNLDLWERYEKVKRNHLSITFEWVKGHNGDEFNEECDKMAVEASKKN